MKQNEIELKSYSNDLDTSILVRAVLSMLFSVLKSIMRLEGSKYVSEIIFRKANKCAKSQNATKLELWYEMNQ